LGADTKATGGLSIAVGSQTTASGWASASFGNVTSAKGSRSISSGDNTTASGDYSASLGYFTKSKPLASVALGHFNDTTCSINAETSWTSTDPIFMIGNGSSDILRSNALTVLRNGRVGIGTSSPSKKLHIEGNTYINGGLQIGSSSGMITANWWEFGIDDGTSGAAIDFHCNSTATDYSARIFRNPGNNGNFDFVNTGSGIFAFYNGVTTGSYTTSGWQHSSDIRLKENIRSLPDVLSDVLKLQGVKFNFINDPEKNQQAGFIAQDFEKVFPELVSTDKNGYKSIAYGQVSVILVEAIKEQQQQIEFQNEKIAELEKEIGEIKAMILK
jgi:hypothetical protein